MNETLQQIPWWAWFALGTFSGWLYSPMWKLAKTYQRWLISRNLEDARR